MVLSRKRPKGVRYYAPFGLSVLVMGLIPRSVGYQDLVALMARQSELSQRARAHMMASPFGTIHAATFSFPQPVGSMIPDPPVYQLASIGTYDPESTGALRSGISNGQYPSNQPRPDFPSVNRRLKGDLLVTRPRGNEAPPSPPPPEGTRDLMPGRVKTVSFPKPADPNPVEAAHVEPPPASYDVASLQPAEAIKSAKTPAVDAEGENSAAARLGRLYFGNTIDEGVGTIQPWPADEELLIETPPAHDPDFKRAALALPTADDF